MLHQIFRLLAPRDLKASVLVCRWWREVWEVQSLWAWVGLRVTRENQTDMLEFLERRNIREVRVEDVSDEVVQAVVKHLG